MANLNRVAADKHRLTGLISASVLVTGLLLMAFVSGASQSSATAATTASPIHSVR